MREPEVYTAAQHHDKSHVEQSLKGLKRQTTVIPEVQWPGHLQGTQIPRQRTSSGNAAGRSEAGNVQFFLSGEIGWLSESFVLRVRSSTDFVLFTS